MSNPTIKWGIKDKTFWNWMELLVVPAVLATGAWYLDKSQTEAQVVREDKRIKVANGIEGGRIEESKRIEDERNKIGILNNYRRSITELIKDGGLHSSQSTDDIVLAARALTISTLPQLGGAQKGGLLSFLFEIELIGGPSGKAAVISLRNADFSDAQLSDGHLGWADLKDANFRRADLTETTFWGAYLNEAFLMEATLKGAELNDANLSGTDLSDANLEEADLRGVTNLTCGQLQEAINWESTYRDENLACGSTIPEYTDENGVFIIEEITN
jgi:hypothetical protein